MKWIVNNNKLLLRCDNSTFEVSSKELIMAIEGTLVKNGELVANPQTDIPNLDLSLSYFFSTLKLVLYLPSEDKIRRPFVSLIATPPISHCIELFYPPTEVFVKNNMVLIFDKDSIESIKNLLNEITLGPISPKTAMKMRLLKNPYIEIIIDDTKCPLIDAVNVVTYGLKPFDYQQKGINWLASVANEDAGCILADEMGLGKTFQIIALLDNQKRKGQSLVVCPNSIMVNWKREIQKFAPQLTSVIHAGKFRTGDRRKLCGCDVVITSYETAVSDWGLLRQEPIWNILVLDEAQYIKNQESKRSQFIRMIPKRVGIAVSGTPFENHISDIWPIFDFCFKGLLGTYKDFLSTYPDNFDGATNLEPVISPLILRRKVADVKKDLPDKVIISESLVMTETEAEEYENCRLEFENEGKVSLGAITKLRMFCSLPSVVNPKNSNDISAKFHRLQEILDEIFILQQKVLIFTPWVQMHQIISSMVENRYCSKCFIMSGVVPIGDRQKLVDAFSATNGFSVMVLNTKVGGAGLNITCANHVIHYSLDWNPAVENQATARAYRTGQLNTVFVHRLFYLGTVEEVIDERLKRKEAMSSEVIRGTDGSEIADIQKAIALSPIKYYRE